MLATQEEMIMTITTAVNRRVAGPGCPHRSPMRALLSGCTTAYARAGAPADKI